MADEFRFQRASELLVVADPRPGRQTRLAQTLGVSRSLVTDWLHGRKRPGGQLLVDLAAYLGTTPDELLPARVGRASGE